MDVKTIAKIIEENGGRLYYVGGCVRDNLMGINSKDIDLCIVGFTKEKFIKLFPNAFLKGESFSVFQLGDYEIALSRRDSKTTVGHKGFLVDTENVSITDDLFRRDLTINSIAKDVLTGEIIDPFNGIDDIKNKIIRKTSNHFSEDPLRVYRAAQFTARLNFTIDNETKELMKSMKNELNTLSPERIFEETRKALKSEKPSIFFEILKELNLLDVHFKEIYDLIGAIQPEIYHPEGDAYVHSMIALDKSAKMTQDEKIRFAALVHDLGKGRTPKEILPHHYEHEKNGIQPVTDLCNRLKVPTAWKKLAKVSVTEHMKAGFFEKMSIPKQVEFLEKNSKYLYELEIIAKADSREDDKIVYFAKLGDKMLSEINGKTIDLPNNKNAKEILHERRVNWLKNISTSY